MEELESDMIEIKEKKNSETEMSRFGDGVHHGVRGTASLWMEATKPMSIK